ncbi:MAG: AI-2E family transporter, partial [Acidimicrobiales bacterium]
MTEQASETTTSPPWARRAIISLLVGIGALWYLRGVVSALRPLLMVLLVSLFLSFALEPAVNRLERRGMRRGPGTFLVLAVMVGALGGFGIQVGSLLAEQVADFSENVPTYLEKIDGWLEDSFGIQHATADLRAEYDSGAL